MMEKTRVTANIAGQEFKLKVNETAEYMESLSRYINSQIAEVQSQYPALSVNNSILLAMLSMADEYHKLKENYEALDSRISALRDMPSRASAPTMPVKRPFDTKTPANV